MALTDKKQKFVEAIKAGKKQREAAIATGCSERSAASMGYKLMKDPDVQRALRNEPIETKSNQNSNPVSQVSQVSGDPLEFLKSVWQDELEDKTLRVKAAQAALPYVHGKVADKGKKESREDAAKKATISGKFRTLSAQMSRPS